MAAIEKLRALANYLREDPTEGQDADFRNIFLTSVAIMERNLAEPGRLIESEETRSGFYDLAIFKIFGGKEPKVLLYQDRVK
jgi:hypothetical protein